MFIETDDIRRHLERLKENADESVSELIDLANKQAEN